ncbi:MAG: RluA family pseudouridine synthase [bacterium]|nr:RluA family pseudouridine synthase [bacterium]
MTMPEDAKPRSFTVTDDEGGLRLDAFLTARCSDLSRSRIQTDLAKGAATVCGRGRPKNHRVRPGDEVAYLPRQNESPRAVPQDIPLQVVYEDRDLVVIDKPVGLVVHPGPGHPDGTLVNGLLHRYGLASVGEDPLRPGIVHRLDRDTSGLLVAALNDQALRSLQAQLQARAMGRTYLALSWGRWPENAGELCGDIGRHPKRRQRMAVVERGGREAVTRYQVEEDYNFVQLCRVELQTGRTHQIRVHFAHRGRPVVGDPVYGDDKRVRGVHNLDRRRADAMVKGAQRQMLHAAELRLVHPVDGRALAFTSEPPADMAAVLAGLRSAD